MTIEETINDAGDNPMWVRFISSGPDAKNITYSWAKGAKLKLNETHLSFEDITVQKPLFDEGRGPTVFMPRDRIVDVIEKKPEKK